MSSYNFKVVLLGEGCVGKTSLVLRYVSNVFNDMHQSTLQASFLKKQLYLDRDLVRLNIWDTAGQERFHALGPIYYREADGALLVYDVTSPQSLRKVRDWIRELNRMLGRQSVRLAIVGNKADLLNGDPSEPRTRQATILIQEAVQLSEELQNARHYLTSAKLNQGIGELFVSLARRMIEQSELRAAQRRDADTALASSRFTRRISLEQEEGQDRSEERDDAHRLADRRARHENTSSCKC